MRELKFRAFVTPWLVKQPEGLPAGMIYEFMGEPYYLGWNEGKLVMILNSALGRALMDKKFWTLMQFTGLKDKNGKDIYEGDIIRRFRQPCAIIDKIDIINYVIFDEKKGKFTVPTGNNWFDLSGYSTIPKPKSEVIGNIYQNSYLLKE